jgi:lysyl-tRNA synthetase class 2
MLPHFIRKIGTQVHPIFVISDEVASILIASCLFVTARGIRLRRRRAWILATFLQSILIVTSLVRSAHLFFRGHENSHVFFKTLGITHLLSEIIILALLLRYKKLFITVADPVSRRQSIFFFLRTAFLTVLLGLLIVYFDARSFVTPVGFSQAFEITVKGLVGISSPAAFVSVHLQERLEFFLGGLGFLLLVSSLIKFLKPTFIKTQLSDENAVLLRELLEQDQNADSLSYFALRENKSVVWSKNMKAAIPYSVVSGVMITSGDPIGDRESWPAAMKSFIEVSELHAWIPAIYGCSETAGEIWVRESGLDALEIGDEAVIDVSAFNLEGSPMKNVRQTINRINRLGYSAHSSIFSEIDPDFRGELNRTVMKWKRNGTERGFAMALGRFCDPQDPDSVITWAQHGNEIMAVLQFVPWGKKSLSLDVMRRSPECETGVNELMIAQTVSFSAARGYEEISLNFASFRSIFERGKRLGAGPITRISHKFLVFLSRFFQMESLYRFNSKFAPEWRPRFVIFPGVGNLIKVGYAILKIEAFIPEFSSPLRRRKSIL